MNGYDQSHSNWAFFWGGVSFAGFVLVVCLLFFCFLFFLVRGRMMMERGGRGGRGGAGGKG